MNNETPWDISTHKKQNFSSISKYLDNTDTGSQRREEPKKNHKRGLGPNIIVNEFGPERFKDAFRLHGPKNGDREMTQMTFGTYK